MKCYNKIVKERRNMKKIFTIILCVLSVFILVGCGKTTTVTTTKEILTTTKSTTTLESTTKYVSDEEYSLDLYYKMLKALQTYEGGTISFDGDFYIDNSDSSILHFHHDLDITAYKLILSTFRVSIDDTKFIDFYLRLDSRNNKHVKDYLYIYISIGFKEFLEEKGIDASSLQDLKYMIDIDDELNQEGSILTPMAIFKSLFATREIGGFVRLLMSYLRGTLLGDDYLPNWEGIEDSIADIATSIINSGLENLDTQVSKEDVLPVVKECFKPFDNEYTVLPPSKEMPYSFGVKSDSQIIDNNMLIKTINRLLGLEEESYSIYHTFSNTLDETYFPTEANISVCLSKSDTIIKELNAKISISKEVSENMPKDEVEEDEYTLISIKDLINSLKIN